MKKKKVIKIIIIIILVGSLIFLISDYLKYKNGCCSCCTDEQETCISMCCKCKGVIFK